MVVLAALVLAMGAAIYKNGSHKTTAVEAAQRAAAAAKELSSSNSRRVQMQSEASNAGEALHNQDLPSAC